MLKSYNIGEKIREARKYRNIKSQTKLCRQLGISRQVWSMWELNRRRPSIEQLKIIADALKIDIRFFMNKDKNAAAYDIAAANPLDSIHSDLYNSQFTFTTNTGKAFNILHAAFSEKGCYVIETAANSGITRIINQFYHNYNSASLIIPYERLNELKTGKIGDNLLLIIDNAEKCNADDWQLIFSFYKKRVGSMVLTGKNLLENLKTYKLEMLITDLLYLNSITICDFENICKALLPGIEGSALNLLKFITNQELHALHKLYLLIIKQQQNDPKFKPTFDGLLKLLEMQLT